MSLHTLYVHWWWKEQICFDWILDQQRQQWKEPTATEYRFIDVEHQRGIEISKFVFLLKIWSLSNLSNDNNSTTKWLTFVSWENDQPGMWLRDDFSSKEDHFFPFSKIFPPMSHPNGNGVTPPTGSVPTSPIQYPPPTLPPIFPPNLSHSPNNFSPSTFPKTNPILLPPSTTNNSFPQAPATLNTTARATPPIQPPSMFPTNANPTPPPQFPQVSLLHQVPQLPIMPSVPASAPTMARQLSMPTPVTQAPPSIPSSQLPHTFNTNGVAPPPMPTPYNSALVNCWNSI